jgi:outer membrane protein assembly factor BamA
MVALLAAPARAEDADVVTTAPAWHFAAIPLVNYSSDQGIGLGVRGKAQRWTPGATLYGASVELQGMASTGGSQFHFASVDFPSLGEGHWRLDALAGYTRNTAAPYYGIGNHEAAATQDAFHSYDEEAPQARLRLRRPLVSHLSAVSGYRLMRVSVRVSPDSLLALDSPTGAQGGPYGELAVGLVWDTRDRELTPRQGVLAELTGRTSQRALGGATPSYGGFASVAAYRAVGSRVVLAGRAAFDAVAGDVPFDRLQDFGSLVSPFYLVDGVGGGLTVRGLLQSEYIGTAKAISNAEVRVQLWDGVFHGEPFGLGAVAFLDAGRVWAPGDRSQLPAAGIHGGLGSGLRIFWGEYFVLRCDAGYAEGRLRVYADFGHIF